MPDLAIKAALGQSGESASETLNQVGVLISRPQLWGQWLGSHPDRAELFKEIFSCVVRLRSQTGWSDDQILKALGCDTKTEEQLSGLTREHLRICLGYMLWVEGLLSAIDLPLEKRDMVRASAQFFAAGSRDLTSVKAAMSEGAFSARDYLSLGETERGWALARRMLKHEGGDPIGEGSDHISPKRLEVLGKPDADELLGPRVAQRMREHIACCTSCRANALDAGIEWQFEDELATD